MVSNFLNDMIIWYGVYIWNRVNMMNTFEYLDFLEENNRVRYRGKLKPTSTFLLKDLISWRGGGNHGGSTLDSELKPIFSISDHDPSIRVF